MAGQVSFVPVHSKKLARPVSKTCQADLGSSRRLWIHLVHTFVPHRSKIGTWKSNEAKNAGTVVKCQSTFDKLMSKYKKEKVDSSVNRPLKKRVFTSEARGTSRAECGVTSVGSNLATSCSTCISLGSPGAASDTLNVGPYGVWVTYPLAAPMHQQRWREPAGHDP